MLFKKLIASILLCSSFLLSNNLYLFGTFDFNRNNKSEVFKLNGTVASLEMIEIDVYGEHQTIWSYNPPNESEIIDIEFSDLNGDETLELIVMLKNIQSDGLIGVFEWNGVEFVSYNDPMRKDLLNAGIKRPSNISSALDIFSISASTPSRSAEILKISFPNGELSTTQKMSFQDTLVTNGHGPIFTGMFMKEEEILTALISFEDNNLKVSIFPLEGYGKSYFSKAIELNGSPKNVLGPEIQAFDEGRDGTQELLIPFKTGEVYAVGLNNENINIYESKLSNLNLFGLSPSSNNTDINNAVLSRIEYGLYDQPFGTVSTVNDSLLALVTDTLLLGDSLQLKILSDKNNNFYSFNWESTPPLGMSFNPDSLQIEWTPTRDNLGVIDLSYSYNIRLNEIIVSGANDLGDTHQLTPILESFDSSLVILIGDTIIPPQPLVILPKRLHSIKISTGDISDSNRFVFEGETPFSSKSFDENGIITIGVDVNLGTIKNDKSSLFTFQSTAKPPESIITLSMTHDLSTNTIYSMISPKKDTLTQSFSPEDLDSKYYKFPTYLYEGFKNDEMGIQATSADSIHILKSEKDASGVIHLSSPLFNDDHIYAISYFGGRPYAIRGDVKINDDSTQKTITEIDFDSSFEPIDINAWLIPANRDTIIIDPDSIPDTLRSKYDYRSFYSPVTILKRNDTQNTKTITSDQPDTLITDPQPSAIPTEESTAIDTNAVLADTTK